jgi:cytochrome c-type biogenesis protein CcmH/NrfG
MIVQNVSEDGRRTDLTFTVSRAELKQYISALERACQEKPQSADLRTCLGMAYAMNYEVYKSMDALELATQLEPEHFFGQLKYAELHYRLRALVRAEQESLKAIELAANRWELNSPGNNCRRFAG